jgi:hypothetical protein
LPAGALAEIPVQTDWQSADNAVSMDVSNMVLCYPCISHNLIPSSSPREIRCGLYIAFRASICHS